MGLLKNLLFIFGRNVDSIPYLLLGVYFLCGYQTGLNLLSEPDYLRNQLISNITESDYVF